MRILLRCVVCTALAGLPFVPVSAASGRLPSGHLSRTTLRVSTAAQLAAAVRSLRSATTVLLAPGVYHLRQPLVVSGPLADVELRGAGATRDAVVLIGADPQAPGAWTPSAIVTSGAVRGLLLANLTIREFSESGVALGRDTSGFRLHDAQLLDAGRAFLRAAGSPGGVVDASAFELTDAGRAAPSGAIEITAGAGWQVRGSTFRGFRGHAGPPRTPAVRLVGSADPDVSANLFIDCEQEIALGAAPEGGAADFDRGIVRNNFVVREPWVGGGPAIAVTAARGTEVLHNSMLLNGSSAAAIEIRHASTAAVLVQNNLGDADILVQDGAQARVTHNETAATPAFFVDPARGDLHLSASATTAIDAGPVHPRAVSDWDGEGRPAGSAADYGADERREAAAVFADTVRTEAAGPSLPAPTAAMTLDASTSLPASWLATDVGSASGSELYSNGSFIVSAAGSDIGGTADQFRFVYQRWTGDGAITARVAYLGETSKWARAGVMVRASLDPGSAHAALLASASHGLVLLQRLETGAATGAVGGASGGVPRWVRLVRSGREITAYASSDGTGWTRAGSATISLPGTIYVGLAVTSRTGSRKTTAVLTDVGVGGAPAPGLPSPWRTGDVGSPAVSGDAAYQAGTFTIAGAGADIWGRADQFRYVYQSLTGDGEVIARVASLQPTHTWAKAGVMIRETLGADARHAHALVSPGGGFALQHRTVAAGSTASIDGLAGAAPGWVRLVRKGSEFTAFRSADGTQWTHIGSATIPMAATVHAGVAVTSHDATRATTAMVTDVAVRPGSSVNEPPTVTLTSPQAGQSFTAPASIALTASAADPDGAVVRVDFYAGATLLGTDTAGPFAFSWREVPAGTYSLTAVAHDASGARTRSAAVSLTVSATTPQPRTLSFAASKDHADVAEYVFEIFKAGADPRTQPAVHAETLGKPAVVDGRITHDVQRVIEALGTGSYFATVSAVNAGGRSRSAPSNTFTR